jgi:hypothetical protein
MILIAINALLSEIFSVRITSLPMFLPLNFTPIYLFLVTFVQVGQDRRVPCSSILAFIISHFPGPLSHRARQSSRYPWLSSERLQGRQVCPDRKNYCTAYGQPPKSLSFRAQPQSFWSRCPPIPRRLEPISLPKLILRPVRALRPRQFFRICLVGHSIMHRSYRLNKIVVPYHGFSNCQSSKESF